MKIDRKYLINACKELLTDEFDSKDIIYKSNRELVYIIINAAYYYKDIIKYLNN